MMPRALCIEEIVRNVSIGLYSGSNRFQIWFDMGRKEKYLCMDFSNSSFCQDDTRLYLFRLSLGIPYWITARFRTVRRRIHLY